MRKNLFVFLSGVFILFSCTKLPADSKAKNDLNSKSTSLGSTSVVEVNTQTLSFTGIGPDDLSGHDNIDNPERGFRLEYIMNISNLISPYNSSQNYQVNFSQTLIQDQNQFLYRNDKLKLAQIYFYIDPALKGVTIPQSQLDNIRKILNEVKLAGFKAILRFAYQTGGDDVTTSTCANGRVAMNSNAPQIQVWHIQNHIQQLTPIFTEYYSVIHAVQTGFVGAYGEWHHDYYGHACWGDATKVILESLLQALPAQRKIMIREPWLKRNAALTGNNRIGYHNDYFVLDYQHKEADYSWMTDAENHEEYTDFNQVLNEGNKICVDGEMPYNGSGSWYLNDVIPGDYAFARRLRAHGYSSLSIVHNYTVNINAWKNKFISASQLRSDNVPVTDGYFTNSSGQEVSRSLYEYIRDHFGYRLQLTSAQLPVSVVRGSFYTYTINLKNFGFATPVNPRNVYLVLIDAANNVKEFLTGANIQSWNPYNNNSNNVYAFSTSLSVSTVFPAGNYRIGLWMPDGTDLLKYNNQYAIKLANKGISWWKDASNKYLINVIGNIQVQ